MIIILVDCSNIGKKFGNCSLCLEAFCRRGYEDWQNLCWNSREVNALLHHCIIPNRLRSKGKNPFVNSFVNDFCNVIMRSYVLNSAKNKLQICFTFDLLSSRNAKLAAITRTYTWSSQ